MENTRKLHSLASVSIAIVLLLILISSTASASITEARITTSGKAANPDIYGNKIVWQDTRNGNSAIYALDLSTKKEIHVNDKLRLTDPAINGNKVVFVRNNTDIYIYDLSTDKKTVIHSGIPFLPVYDPAIYGNLVAWEFDQPTSIDAKIRCYDLSTQQTTDLAGYSTAWSPAIYGKRIVWTEGNESYNSPDIHMYDLSSPQDRWGTWISHSGKANISDIYSDKIVWADNLSGNWDIYMYDLSTMKETQITTNPSDSINPVIYGNNLVWQDNRNGNWDIYAYDLITHQQIHTTNKADQIAPAIYGNNVVWTDYRNGKPDIYMGDISYIPVAAFTASPISGKKPLTVKFTDKSTDAYYWYWDFGDKSTSTLQNSAHKYTKAGTYTVTLKVKNAAGSNTAKKTNYITVK
ncbi:MAG: hypothetical protein QG646_2745 [Euryarchaeota archaeon]|nr:hypothetical protein [Euryarchaeota archaeon]